MEFAFVVARMSTSLALEINRFLDGSAGNFSRIVAHPTDVNIVFIAAGSLIILQVCCYISENM